jgi:K+-transporting ATPase KdpF subunit
MKLLFLLLTTTEENVPSGYLMGAILAVILLGYLIYSLIKPEKF